jgi:hypothetical protein
MRYGSVLLFALGFFFDFRFMSLRPFLPQIRQLFFINRPLLHERRGLRARRCRDVQGPSAENGSGLTREIDISEVNTIKIGRQKSEVIPLGCG